VVWRVPCSPVSVPRLPADAFTRADAAIGRRRSGAADPGSRGGATLRRCEDTTTDERVHGLGEGRTKAARRGISGRTQRRSQQNAR